MFNATTLAALLAVTIGFRQPPDEAPDELPLEADLVAPTGTLPLQDVHPLLTLTNLVLSAPQVPASGQDRAAQLSQYLRQARVTAATKVLTAWAERRTLTGAGKTLLSDTQLTSQSASYRDKIIKEGRFVGLSLRATTPRDVRVTVSAVGTQFTEHNPNFVLYLYHESGGGSNPVASYPLPRVSQVYTEWDPVTIALPKKGTYYLGYYETDLLGQAMRLDRDFERRGCGTCSSDYVLHDLWHPLVHVAGFSAIPDLDGGTVDLLHVTTYTDFNFGLNLRLCAACDLTEFLAGQLGLFTSALRLQLAADLLNVMAYSTRNNGVASETKQMALLELNNRVSGQQGLLSKLDSALQALEVDLSGLAKPCLGSAPSSKSTIRHTTI